MYFEGRFVGVDPGSGLSCPDIRKLAAGFGLPSLRIATHRGMRATIRKALALAGPVVVEVVLDPLQAIEPRVKSERLPDGRMVSKPLEDMWPYLDRDLLRREMIVPPVGE
jgi:acetolactate synthase-1/2/3 large subunit